MTCKHQDQDCTRIRPCTDCRIYRDGPLDDGSGGRACLLKCVSEDVNEETGEPEVLVDYKISPHRDLDYDRDCYWIYGRQEAAADVRSLRHQALWG